MTEQSFPTQAQVVVIGGGMIHCVTQQQPAARLITSLDQEPPHTKCWAEQNPSQSEDD